MSFKTAYAACKLLITTAENDDVVRVWQCHCAGNGGHSHCRTPHGRLQPMAAYQVVTLYLPTDSSTFKASCCHTYVFDSIDHGVIQQHFPS
jgi:hypothetical protein